MEDEPTVIRQQMQDKRTELTEKLEALEQKVTSTVESVTTAVTDTVQSATEAVSHTVASVQDTMTAVKDNVTGTVEAVKDSLGDTVESVRHALDVQAQTAEHPWLMFGGSVAVGFAIGALIPAGRSSGSWSGGPGMMQSAWDTMTGSGVPHGHTNSGSRLSSGMSAASAHIPERPAPAPAWSGHSADRASQGPGLLGSLFQSFGPELDKLKGLAIGMALGAARDAILSAVPPHLNTQVGELVNNVTRKLGGEPVRPQPQPSHRPA